MLRLYYLSPTLAVAGALAPADFAEVARRGFKTVINNRPDGEEEGQIAAGDAACHAGDAGLAFLHIPAVKHEILDDRVLEPLAEALATADGPVLLHCRSGLRSAIMWAALSLDAGVPLADILTAARYAGFDLEGVREELAERAAAAAAAATTDLQRVAPHRAAA